MNVLNRFDIKKRYPSEFKKGSYILFSIYYNDLTQNTFKFEFMKKKYYKKNVKVSNKDMFDEFHHALDLK